MSDVKDFEEMKAGLLELKEMMQAANIDPQEFWQNLGFDPDHIARLAAVMSMASKMLGQDVDPHAYLASMQVGAALALEARARGKQRQIVI